MDDTSPQPTDDPAPPMFSGALKTTFCFSGIVVPVFCFLLASQGSPLAPEWQSGNVSDYAKLLLGGYSHNAFYPLLGWAMISLALTFVNVEIAKKYFAVRLGIYGGVFLALTFSVVFSLAMGKEPWLGAVFGTLGMMVSGSIAMLIMYGLCRIAAGTFGKDERSNSVVSFFIGMLLVGLLISIGWGGLFLFLGPSCAFVTYLYVAYVLIRKGKQITIAQLLGSTTYMAAYMAAGRHSLLRMMEEYSQLPLEPPPGCYVATAAAKGHPVLVRSWLVQQADGTLRPVNRQLQILKAGELAIACWLPRFHRFLRQHYNCWGPRLASFLAWCWLADLAYLLLKPVEWCVVLVLRLVAPGALKLVPRLYRSVEG
jgi:hypothetical protein